MKQSILKLFIILFIVLGIANGYSQTIEQRADALFDKIKYQMIQKNADSIYDLAAPKFKENVAREKFVTFCQKNFFNLGHFVTSSKWKFENGASWYRMTFGENTFRLMLVVDSEGHYTGFKALAGADSTAARKFIATSNPRQTMLDRAIDTIALTYLNKKHAVGLSIGVYRKGKEMTYNYGEVRKGNKTLPDSNTLFEIGSITKVFTTTLAAYYDGLHTISLDDPITKYLPDDVDSNQALKGITIRMLCTHTSGLFRIPNNLFGSGAEMTNPYKSYSKEKLFEYLKVCTTESKPGEKVSYSNLGVGLCGVILERATGLTYEQMVQDVICKPLKMTHTIQHIPADKKYLLTEVYTDKGKEATAWDFDALAGAGSLHSTAGDMLSFAKANIKWEPNNLSNAMRVTHMINFDKDIKIGLGWILSTAGRSPFYWHNGGTAGSCSFIAFDEKNDIAIVVLSNQATMVDDAALEILQAVEDVN